MTRFKDNEEARAWDLYAAAFASLHINTAEGIADDADELLEERRKRAWDYCHKCKTARKWFEKAEGRRCANCGVIET